jgi:hypothetical protein
MALIDRFYFKHPTTIQISGPTGCGKTFFVRRMLQERLVMPFPTRIIWVYSEWQSDYDKVRETFPQTEFIEGWRDDIYDSIKPDERNLLILDDQMDEAGDSKTLAKLFTKGSHHRNLTIIYLVQNVFNQAKSQRTVSLNSHYNVIFRNKRDTSQFRTLAYQMCPENGRWLLDVFNYVTRLPHGYLILDLHPTTDEEDSVVTNIFFGERITYYLENKRNPINTSSARGSKRPNTSDGERIPAKTKKESGQNC